MSGIGRARWTSSGDRPNTGRWPYGVCLKMGVFFCRCGSNYRPEVGRTSEGIRRVPEQVTGHRAIAGRVVNGHWTMTGRCSSDVTRTWVPSYSVLPSRHCQFINMAAPRRLRMALLNHEMAQAMFQYNLVLAAILEADERERQIQLAECCTQTGANSLYTSIDIWPAYGRVPVEFRPSIGRCPLHRSATGTILSKALSHIGRRSVGARPVSVKKTSSTGCLRCTGHRPILGRAPVDVFSDVVTMGLRWGGSVRTRLNLAPKLKIHRAATDAVLRNTRHGCPAGVWPVFGRVRWKSHHWLIGTSSAGLCDWAIMHVKILQKKWNCWKCANSTSFIYVSIHRNS